jgi:hypothetical protein
MSNGQFAKVLHIYLVFDEVAAAGSDDPSDLAVAAAVEESRSQAGELEVSIGLSQ